MIMHLEFYENWSGKSGNFVVENEWEPCLMLIKYGNWSGLNCLVQALYKSYNFKTSICLTLGVIRYIQINGVLGRERIWNMTIFHCN